MGPAPRLACLPVRDLGRVVRVHVCAPLDVGTTPADVGSLVVVLAAPLRDELPAVSVAEPALAALAAAALAATLPQFAEGSHVGVIVCLDGDIDILLHDLGDIEHLPADVHGTAYQRTVVIHRTGGTYADSSELLHRNVLLFHLCQQALCHIRDDILAAVRLVGGNLPLVQYHALLREQADLHCGSSHIYSKCVLTHTEFLHESVL